MNDGSPQGTVDDVFRDFKGRRAGLIRALTTDVEEFYKKCDPEKENLCLYGLPNASWEVNLPVEDVPPEVPEPVLGINFARDGMQQKDWLSLVAVHSDAWLLSLAFYFGSRFNFDKAQRKHLFDLINDLPTVFEAITQKKQAKTPGSKQSSNKSKSNSKMGAPDSQPKQSRPSPTKEEDEGYDQEEQEEEEDDREEQGDTQCGACGESTGADEFWICCDICEKWFHGKCVKITPAKAEFIKQYKCPSCSNKRARN